MSEPAGIENEPIKNEPINACCVCGETADNAEQTLGCCVDTISCVERWVGIRKRRENLKRTGGSDGDRELRITQARESREQ